MAYRATHASTESLILDLVRARKSLTLEQLITLLPELTWNQVFRTVDELSRRGAIILLRKGFQYELAWVSAKNRPYRVSAKRALRLARAFVLRRPSSPGPARPGPCRENHVRLSVAAESRMHS